MTNNFEQKILTGNFKLSKLYELPLPVRLILKILIFLLIVCITLLFVPCSVIFFLIYLVSGFNRTLIMRMTTFFSYVLWGLFVILLYLSMEVKVQVEEELEEVLEKSPQTFSESNLEQSISVISQRIQKKERKKSGLTLVIPNHTCAPDFLSHTLIALYMGVHKDLKYFLKTSLICIPIIGYSLWFLQFCFLSRNKSKDEANMREYVKKMSACTLKSQEKGNKNGSEQKITENICGERSTWIILYSEGTRYTPEKSLQSQEFCKSRGIKPFNHVLAPRPAGFRVLRESIEFDRVMDVTSLFVYPDFDYNSKRGLFYPTPSPISIIFGFPKCKLFVNCMIREEYDNSDEFLYKIFRRKDKILKEWRENGKF